MSQQDHINTLIETVTQWDDIADVPHRFGGTEFKVGKTEIGHVHHSNGMVDIPFTVVIREALVREGLAQTHHLLKDSGWITCFVRDESSLETAIRLMRLSYLQKTGRRRGVDMDAIKELNLSAAVRRAAFPRL